MNSSSISYKRHRFPPQIIARAVLLYVRFNLSLREIEAMLLQRGIDVSYETVRRWVIKFGPQIARIFRRRQDRPGDIWHLDEGFVKVSGRKYWLWCTVDQHGVVLDDILQPKRDKRAIKQVITPGWEHWSHKDLNNRSENWTCRVFVPLQVLV